MQILIDGYNLLFAFGFRGDLSAPGQLEQARLRMLDKLARHLSVDERKATVIIFDAGKRSRSKGERFERQEMKAIFSYDFRDADSMIEELIQQHDLPQKLLVVSSDHRIQNAARRKKASFVDSDKWIDELESREFETRSPAPPPREKLREDAEYWLNLFPVDEVQQIIDEANECERTESLPELKESDSCEFDSDELELDELANPFPDDFGNDLELD